MKYFAVLALPILLAVPAFAAAQEHAECNFESNGGTIASSYDLIGVEACIDFCGATDGCTAWLYTPHNFNPTGAPGHCQVYAEATGSRAPDSTAPNQFCGQMGG